MRNVPLATIRKGMKAMDALEMSEEEKAQVGFYQTPEGAGWEDSEHIFLVEIKDKEAKNLVLSRLELEVRTKNENDSWNMGDIKVLELCEKLDMEVENGN